MTAHYDMLTEPTTGRQVLAASLEESQLVEGTRRRYQPYVAELYRRYRPTMMRVAGALARDHGEDFLEEVVTDVFMQLPGKLQRYREEGRFEKFLAGVVFNVTRTKLRSRTREWERFRPLDDDDPHGRDASAVWKAVESDLVVRASGLLTDAERQVFILAHYGWDAPEIARELGCQAGAVWTRLSRARAKVRRLLSPTAD